MPDKSRAIVISPDIIRCKSVIPWGEELIKVAEEVGGWSRSSQSSTNGKRGFRNVNRTSHGQVISGKVDQRFARFEYALADALHSCAFHYKQYNNHLHVVRSTEFQILKYEPGQQFKTHVDAIAGLSEGDRQLSAVAYLNDNYCGGQIAFPRQELKVKPTAGDILLFPANFCYPHASLPVTSGIKYAVVTWFVATQKKAVTKR